MCDGKIHWVCLFLLKFVLVTFKWGGQQTECGLKGFGIVSLKIVALNLKICFNPNFWKPFAQSNNNVLESRIDDKGSKNCLGCSTIYVRNFKSRKVHSYFPFRYFHDYFINSCYEISWDFKSLSFRTEDRYLTCNIPFMYSRLKKLYYSQKIRNTKHTILCKNTHIAFSIIYQLLLSN